MLICLNDIVKYNKNTVDELKYFKSKLVIQINLLLTTKTNYHVIIGFYQVFLPCNPLKLVVTDLLSM